jgi:predicted RNA-binding Zn-ribbon protein involved in translation (DUF1610 family)
MAISEDENGVLWSSIDCPNCGEPGPNQQAREESNHHFICSECSYEFSDG